MWWRCIEKKCGKCGNVENVENVKILLTQMNNYLVIIF